MVVAFSSWGGWTAFPLLIQSSGHLFYRLRDKCISSLWQRSGRSEPFNLTPYSLPFALSSPPTPFFFVTSPAIPPSIPPDFSSAVCDKVMMANFGPIYLGLFLFIGFIIYSLNINTRPSKHFTFGSSSTLMATDNFPLLPLSPNYFGGACRPPSFPANHSPIPPFHHLHPFSPHQYCPPFPLAFATIAALSVARFHAQMLSAGSRQPFHSPPRLHLNSLADGHFHSIQPI